MVRSHELDLLRNWRAWSRGVAAMCSPSEAFRHGWAAVPSCCWSCGAAPLQPTLSTSCCRGNNTENGLAGVAAKCHLQNTYKSWIGLASASKNYHVASPAAVADRCLVSHWRVFQCWVSGSLLAYEKAWWHFNSFLILCWILLPR